jgi:hypothetical protein
MCHRPVRRRQIPDHPAVDNFHRQRFDAVRVPDFDPETALGLSVGCDLTQRQAVAGDVHQQAGSDPWGRVADLEKLDALAGDLVERFHVILTIPALPTMRGRCGMIQALRRSFGGESAPFAIVVP